MKEKVILEKLEEEKVAVYNYFDGTISVPEEVTHISVAMENYDIVGEIVEGEIVLYDEDKDEEEDYMSEFAIDEDDD